MTREHGTADASGGRQQELDARIERLVAQVVEAVNGADPQQRPALRDYALGLLREGTEVDVPAPSPAGPRGQAGTNPIGIALLLGLVGLPAVLLFPPIGLTLVAIAAVMGVWGVVGSLVGRSRRG